MKGQISFVEYLAALSVFIASIVFIAYQIINFVPAYLKAANDERIRINAYQISELLINDPGNPVDWEGRATLSVVRLKFDEESGTSASDSSGNGNTGTLVNGPTWTTGMFGNALNLDGDSNDYVVIQNSPSLNFETGDFAVSMWLKYPSQAGVNYDYSIILGNQGTASEGIVCFADVKGTVPDNNGYVECRVQGGNYVDSVSSGLNDNTWRFFTFVRQGTTLYLYINGRLDNSKSISSINVTTGQPFVIGANSVSNPTAQNFAGLIDELQIWDRSLSADEIVELYQNIIIPTIQELDYLANT